jgi:hypothetical protein
MGIRDIRKVRKRQHQYPEFGHISQAEIKKRAKKYISINGELKPSILMVPRVSSYLSFFPSASVA